VSRRRYRCEKKSDGLEQVFSVSDAGSTDCFGWATRRLKASWSNPRQYSCWVGQRSERSLQLSQSAPNLPIWISGGTPEDYAEQVFAKAELTAVA